MTTLTVQDYYFGFLTTIPRDKAKFVAETYFVFALDNTKDPQMKAKFVVDGDRMLLEPITSMESINIAAGISNAFAAWKLDLFGNEISPNLLLNLNSTLELIVHHFNLVVHIMKEKSQIRRDEMSDLLNKYSFEKYLTGFDKDSKFTGFKNICVAYLNTAHTSFIESLIYANRSKQIEPIKNAHRNFVKQVLTNNIIKTEAQFLSCKVHVDNAFKQLLAVVLEIYSKNKKYETIDYKNEYRTSLKAGVKDIITQPFDGYRINSVLYDTTLWKESFANKIVEQIIDRVVFVCAYTSNEDFKFTNDVLPVIEKEPDTTLFMTSMYGQKCAMYRVLNYYIEMGSKEKNNLKQLLIKSLACIVMYVVYISNFNIKDQFTKYLKEHNNHSIFLIDIFQTYANSSDPVNHRSVYESFFLTCIDYWEKIYNKYPFQQTIVTPSMTALMDSWFKSPIVAANDIFVEFWKTAEPMFGSMMPVTFHGLVATKWFTSVIQEARNTVVFDKFTQYDVYRAHLVNLIKNRERDIVSMVYFTCNPATFSAEKGSVNTLYVTFKTECSASLVDVSSVNKNLVELDKKLATVDKEGFQLFKDIIPPQFARRRTSIGTEINTMKRDSESLTNYRFIYNMSPSTPNLLSCDQYTTMINFYRIQLSARHMYTSTYRVLDAVLPLIDNSIDELMTQIISELAQRPEVPSGAQQVPLNTQNPLPSDTPVRNYTTLGRGAMNKRVQNGPPTQAVEQVPRKRQASVADTSLGAPADKIRKLDSYNPLDNQQDYVGNKWHLVAQLIDQKISVLLYEYTGDSYVQLTYMDGQSMQMYTIYDEKQKYLLRHDDATNVDLIYIPLFVHQAPPFLTDGNLIFVKSSFFNIANNSDLSKMFDGSQFFSDKPPNAFIIPHGDTLTQVLMSAYNSEWFIRVFHFSGGWAILRYGFNNTSYLNVVPTPSNELILTPQYVGAKVSVYKSNIQDDVGNTLFFARISLKNSELFKTSVDTFFVLESSIAGLLNSIPEKLAFTITTDVEKASRFYKNPPAIQRQIFVPLEQNQNNQLVIRTYTIGPQNFWKVLIDRPNGVLTHVPNEVDLTIVQDATTYFIVFSIDECKPIYSQPSVYFIMAKPIVLAQVPDSIADTEIQVAEVTDVVSSNILIRIGERMKNFTGIVSQNVSNKAFWTMYKVINYLNKRHGEPMQTQLPELTPWSSVRLLATAATKFVANTLLEFFDYLYTMILDVKLNKLPIETLQSVYNSIKNSSLREKYDSTKSLLSNIYQSLFRRYTDFSTLVDTKWSYSYWKEVGTTASSTESQRAMWSLVDNGMKAAMAIVALAKSQTPQSIQTILQTIVESRVVVGTINMYKSVEKSFVSYMSMAGINLPSKKVTAVVVAFSYLIQRIMGVPLISAPLDLAMWFTSGTLNVLVALGNYLYYLVRPRPAPTLASQMQSKVPQIMGVGVEIFETTKNVFSKMNFGSIVGFGALVLSMIAMGIMSLVNAVTSSGDVSYYGLPSSDNCIEEWLKTERARLSFHKLWQTSRSVPSLKSELPDSLAKITPNTCIKEYNASLTKWKRYAKARNFDKATEVWSDSLADVSDEIQEYMRKRNVSRQARQAVTDLQNLVEQTLNQSSRY